MQRLLLVIATILIIFPVNIYGLETKSIESLGFDTSIFKSNYETSLPSSILVVPIFMPNQTGLTEENWIKGIYYYTVERLGYPTLPFHYLVDSRGNIYNSSSTDDRSFLIKDVNSNNIVIAYLAKPNSTNFSDSNREVLGNLILDTANNNAIDLNNIETSGLKFTRDNETSLVFAEKTNIFGLWQNGLNEIVDQIRSRYAPITKEYSVEVNEVKVVSPDIVAGQETDGIIKITNTGSNNIYIDDNNFLLSEKADGGNSRFYVNNVWVSQSQFPAVKERQTIKVGQSVDVNFKLRASLFPGEQKEQFKIRLVGKGNLNSNNFEIRLNIQRGDKKIIQINETETNFLRVRNEPSTAANEVGRVASGERYFVLEENENGFLRIDLGSGSSGWVAGWLTTEI